MAEHFVRQLESILSDFDKGEHDARFQNPGSLRKLITNLITRSIAAVERASGRDSVYSKQIQEILPRSNFLDSEKLSMILGVVESLVEDIKAGYFSTASELLHGEIFGDFLEMAYHLLSEGYKDAAAVISGGALESHLRQLCFKNGLSLEVNDARGVRPKRAESLNSELANTNAISRLDQKNVTAWLDLRNKAAHARYDEYSKEQVSLLVAGIRDFLIRHPA